MKPDLIEYRRQLAEAALARQCGPVTAGDLLESMISLAEAEGHPPWVWKTLSTKEVHGALRSARADGGAKVVGEAKSGRHGRMEPTWERTSETQRDVPTPPDAAERINPLAGTQWEHHTRGQLIALLEIGESLAGKVGRFMAEFGELSAAARDRLRAAGFSDPSARADR